MSDRSVQTSPGWAVRLRGLLSAPFGCVFQREMRVTGRNKWTYAFRSMAVLSVVLVAGLTLFGAIDSMNSVTIIDGERQVAGSAERLEQIQGIAPNVAIAVLWPLFIGAAGVGAVIGAPAVCDERRARTIGVMATVPLPALAVIMGLVSARFVQVLILVLLVMPLLLVLRVFGGVSAAPLLLGIAVVIATMLLTISIAVWSSVTARKSTAAFGAAISFLFGFSIAPVLWFGLAEGDLVPPPPDMIWGASPMFVMIGITGALLGESPPMLVSGVGYYVAWWCGISVALSFLFMFAAAMRYRTASVAAAAFGFEKATKKRAIPKIAGKRRVAQRLGEGWKKWSDGIVFAIGATVILFVPPISVLRMIEDYGIWAALIGVAVVLVWGAGFAAGPLMRARRRRATLAVGDRPVLWRELAQPVFAQPRFAVVAAAAAIGTIGMFMWFGDLDDHEIYFPFVVMGSIATLFIAAVVSPASVPEEREAQTLDVLLATPISARAILIGKALGAGRRLWPVLAPMGAILFAAVVFGGVSPIPVLMLMLPGLLGALVFLIGVGLYLGTRVRKAVTANIANLGLAVALWVVIPMMIGIVVDAFDLPTRELSYAIPGHPVATCVFAYEWARFYETKSELGDVEMTIVEAGVLAWGYAAAYAGVGLLAMARGAKRLRGGAMKG